MPTVLRIGPYRFFFYSGNNDKPQHVHVERDDNVAKFWLDPIMLHNNVGFSRSEIRRIHNLIEEHLSKLVEAWDDYFGS